MGRPAPDRQRGLPSLVAEHSFVYSRGLIGYDQFTDAERAELTKRATDAYVQVARPAFEKLRDFLGTRYLPACRQTTAAASLRDGPALYAYNVKWHTTTSMSPQQIHETGLAEVKRIHAEMDKLIDAARFEGDPKKYLEQVKSFTALFLKDLPRVPLYQPYLDVAMQRSIDGYVYWFHRQLDYRQIEKK